MQPPVTMSTMPIAIAWEALDCEGVPGGTATIGSACDDGDATTATCHDANYRYVGEALDCEGVPGGTATIGSACDDGDTPQAMMSTARTVIVWAKRWTAKACRVVQQRSAVPVMTETRTQLVIPTAVTVSALAR